jgi:hypothetical protein
MKFPKQKVLMAGAILAAAANAFAAPAVDQNAWFECERQITDGSYPDCSPEALAKRAAANDVKGPPPPKGAVPGSGNTEPMKFKWFAHPLRLIDATY